MFHRTIWVALASAAGVLAMPAVASAQSCDDIVLGAALSASGLYAANGTNTRNGYEFAVKKINDDGGVTINGKCYHFKIKYYDDESTPARAAQLVERLISQDHVKYMLGPYSSPLAKAVLPVTEKYKTPVVQAEAASRSLFTQGYKYHFGIIATSDKYLAPVIDMAADRARKAGKETSSLKVAMIFQDDPFSLDVRTGVVDEMKKYGMKAVVDDRMPKDLNDLSAFFTKVKALKPDVLLVSGHEKGAATAMREMSENRVEVPLVGMTHCESAKITIDFPKAAEGIVCPTQWAPTIKASDPVFGTAANYDKQMKAAHDYKVVPYQTAEASAALLVYRDAFKRAQSLDPQKVRDALAKTDIETFCGHVKFAADGSNPGKQMIMRQITGDKYHVIWPQKLATAQLNFPRNVTY